jgi:hypothetical protein
MENRSSNGLRITIPLAVLRLALARFDELGRLAIARTPLPRPPPASLYPLARSPEPRCELLTEGFAGFASEGGASSGAAHR